MLEVYFVIALGLLYLLRNFGLFSFLRFIAVFDWKFFISYFYSHLFVVVRINFWVSAAVAVAMAAENLLLAFFLLGFKL